MSGCSADCRSVTAPGGWFLHTAALKWATTKTQIPVLTGQLGYKHRTWWHSSRTPGCFCWWYFHWSIRILLVRPRFCWFCLFTLWMFLWCLLNVAFTVYLKQSETRRPNTSVVCMQSVLNGFWSDRSRNSSVTAFTRLHNTQEQDLKTFHTLSSLKVTSGGEWCQTSVV